jgi:Glutathione S-transferase
MHRRPQYGDSSAAINEYLVETYDPAGTLWYQDGPNKFLMKQWLYFQMSGQGPYYGQGVSQLLVLFPHLVADLGSSHKRPGSCIDTRSICPRRLAATEGKFVE